MKKALVFSASEFLIVRTAVFGFACLVFSLTSFAQDELPPDDLAPPPIKMISAVEKKSLESESAFKKRAKLGMELMEERLVLADKAAVGENFKESLEHLAGFQALMDYVFAMLTTNDVNNKADGRFKQFEIYLRRQMPRIETIRRQMPYRYGYYVIKIIKNVRETRSKAVEPLFGEALSRRRDFPVDEKTI